MALGPAYSRAERLLNLLMALRSTRVGLDRAQIRDQVRGYPEGDAAFERMFERDKDALRELGIPLRTLTDPSGSVTGYRVDAAALPPLDLDPAQLAVLALAARAWQHAELGSAALNALRKVEARLGMRSAAPANPPVAGLSTDAEALPALIRACAGRIPVTFEYRRADGQAGSRSVAPWGVVSWRGHWYLVGLDEDRQDTRVFRASRIVGQARLHPDRAGYVVPDGFDARAAIGRFDESDRIVLEVDVAPSSANDLRREAVGTVPGGAGAGGSDARSVDRLRDGAAAGDAGVEWERLQIPAPRLTPAVARVLADWPSAQVAGPPEARVEALAQWGAIRTAHLSAPAQAGRPIAARPARPEAIAQFTRLLALVPWLAANSGVRIADAAAHFGISTAQLLDDLASVITSGSDDWTLFDIQYWDDDGVIEVIDALDLDRPLTLTPDEGFALLVALDALAVVPGGHDRAILVSTAGALRRNLGPAAPAVGAVGVRVDLPEPVVAAVAEAQAGGRALELTYVDQVRDRVTTRTVDPIGVVVVDGHGYLRAHCRTAGALRLFRLDRILTALVSELPAQPAGVGEPAVEPMAVILAGTGRRVVVDIAPEGADLMAVHPRTAAWSLPDGWVRAELPVGEFEWARRLVLGSAGTVVLREPEWLADQVRAAAEEALTALTAAPDAQEDQIIAER